MTEKKAKQTKMTKKRERQKVGKNTENNKEIEEKKQKKKKDNKSDVYFEAVGRRKTAIARVRLYNQGEKNIFVNDKLYSEYFPVLTHQKVVAASLERLKLLGRFRISVKVRGGGISAQAEAIRHGIARALVKFNPNFRKKLRKAGFLTRDSRMKERKKFGLRRARRAFQWRKR